MKFSSTAIMFLATMVDQSVLAAPNNNSTNITHVLAAEPAPEPNLSIKIAKADHLGQFQAPSSSYFEPIRVFIPELADEYPDGILVDGIKFDEEVGLDGISSDDAADAAPDVQVFDGNSTATPPSIHRKMQLVGDDQCGPRQLVHLAFDDNKTTVPVSIRPLGGRDLRTTVDVGVYQFTQQDKEEILHRLAFNYLGFSVDIVLELPNDVPQNCITTIGMSGSFRTEFRFKQNPDGNFQLKGFNFGFSPAIDFLNLIRNKVAFVDIDFFSIANHFLGKEGLLAFMDPTAFDNNLPGEEIVRLAAITTASETGAHELGHTMAGLRHHDCYPQSFPTISDPNFPPGFKLFPPSTEELNLEPRLMAAAGLNPAYYQGDKFFSERSLVKLALSVGIDWNGFDKSMDDTFVQKLHVGSLAVNDPTPSLRGSSGNIFQSSKKSQKSADSRRRLSKSTKSSKSSSSSGSTSSGSSSNSSSRPMPPFFNRHEYMTTEHAAKARVSPLSLKDLLVPNPTQDGPFSNGDVLKASALVISGSIEPPSMPLVQSLDPIESDSYPFNFEQGQLINAELIGRIRPQSSLVATMRIISEHDGAVLCDNLSGYEGDEAICLNVLIPSTGTYLIQISTFAFFPAANLHGTYDICIYNIDQAMDRAAAGF